jgi:hypothetical protein
MKRFAHFAGIPTAIVLMTAALRAGDTEQPPASTSTGGTGTEPPSQPQFVTVEDFGKTAGIISGLQKALKPLSDGTAILGVLEQVGLVVKGDDGKYKPFNAQAAETTKPDKVDPVKAENEDLKRKLTDHARQLEERDQRAAATDKQAAIVKALQDAGAHNPSRDYVHLLGPVKRNDQGEYYVDGKGKYGEDAQIPLSEFSAAFLAKNPELKSATNKTGSDTKPGASSTGVTATGAKIIPRATWTDMTYYAANREKFISGEYVRGN